MEPCCINLLFLYRFEAIFNWCFNATHTIGTEPMWCHVSELQANFKAPTYEVLGGMLVPVDKECMGSCPKMFLFTLDELSHVYQCINNTNAQCVIVYEILSFVSDRCTERWDGRLKPECDMFGPAMPHIHLRDVRNLERLTWPCMTGSWPAISGQHSWACVLNKAKTHISKGGHCGSTTPSHHWRSQHSHCFPPERGPSGEAVWEKKLAEETPSTAGTSLSCLQDTNALVSHKHAIKCHLSPS